MAGPPVLKPMLTGGTRPPADPTGWLVEPKWDGVRVIVTIADGHVKLVSRNGNDVSGGYPELARPPLSLAGRDVVLDAEVVAIDESGHPSFGLLQRRMHVRAPPPALVSEVPIALAVFDVLWVDGTLLTSRPLRSRRETLAALSIDDPPWLTSPVLDLVPGPDLQRTGRELGIEGFLIKRADSTYLPGHRSDAWIKVKSIRRREFVVGGWLEGRGGRTGSLGSLAVGVYDGPLYFVGMVGSGLSAADLEAFRVMAGGLARADSPFANPTPPGVRFLEPALVAEVTFSEVTSAGTLRHPVLVGFRTDLDASEVVVDAELEGFVRPTG
jgi:bifunctional non-homologous end joining protein LigD